MPAKRKGPTVKVEPSPKQPKTLGIKKALSTSSVASDATEVPTASLSLPHVKMFTDW